MTLIHLDESVRYVQKQPGSAAIVWMIKDLEVAQYISDLMIEVGGRLDSSVQVVARKCPQEESQAYKRAVGNVLGEMLLQIMNPLYRVHPSLKPHGLE